MNTVNLRDVQQLHDGIVLAMDALRRITPQVALGETTPRYFPYGSDPFGVAASPLDHTAAYRGIGGLGINPLPWGPSGFGHNGWGQSAGYGYGLPSFGYGMSIGMQPYGYDAWTRGMTHSGMPSILGAVHGGMGAPVAYVPVRAF